MCTRRQVLVSIAMSAAAGGGCAVGHRYLARRERPQDREVSIPDREIARLRDDDVLVVQVEGSPLELIVRRAGAGYVALVPRCTHRGCALDVVPDGFDCPCHGATFDRLGHVLGGPASDPLPALPTRLRGDGLWIALPA